MREFFAAMQEIIRAGEPAPKRDPFACRHCIDGEREDGSGCPHCDGWDGVVDGHDD